MSVQTTQMSCRPTNMTVQTPLDVAFAPARTDVLAGACHSERPVRTGNCHGVA